MLWVALEGFRLGFGLILAIGVQNSFVLQQGLKRQHVFAVCAFCALSDAALITAGTMGAAQVLDTVPGLWGCARWLGACVTGYYALRSLRVALRSGTTNIAAPRKDIGCLQTLAVLALLTWCNPHVWFDTVVLIGTVGARFHGQAHVFAAGAAAASLVFFFALGFGARVFAPVLTRPVAWRFVEGTSGAMMASVAVRLVQG